MSAVPLSATEVPTTTPAVAPAVAPADAPASTIERMARDVSLIAVSRINRINRCVDASTVMIRDDGNANAAAPFPTAATPPLADVAAVVVDDILPVEEAVVVVVVWPSVVAVAAVTVAVICHSVNRSTLDMDIERG